MNKKIRKRAEEALQDKDAMDRLLRTAAVKADRHRDKFPEIWGHFKALFRMVKAWFQGNYREVPWKILVAAVAAILYFINPFDLVPDFFLGGYVDDAVFVGWVITAIRGDLEKFLLWERTISVSTDQMH